ncbi:hypothetical protein [Hymenobacter arizonensis]|uniref:DUF3298 domain-containing protein n=1 Tax=Hymenobacter arizonensis TaxID=1227077 RepID=A0A1I5YZV0_HYMAR|nr:hypothetical protein [Hymenobacter arizonensis]SFQ49387.1 hypothetical protein SAMN04515668_2550 [Hymenobacter arizonensis]
MVASYLLPRCILAASLLWAGTAAAPPAPAALPRPGQEQYRRYRGQVAGRPVLVELSFRRLSGLPKGHQLDLFGRSYDWVTGEEQTLRPVGLFLPASPLTLGVEADPGQWPRWRATQPLGPVLSGTCKASPQAPSQPFALREDYTGAVRYELLTETTAGGRGLSAHGEPARAYVEVTYLHLLGPDTLRPALARLQCPGPARRRRARHPLGQVASRQDFATVYNQSLAVTLNEQDLLAYGTYTVEGVVDLRHAQHSWDNVVYDLRTGQPIDLLALLRPGGPATVQRLITRELRRGDPAFAAELGLDAELLPLPDEGFALTPTGWQATYQTAPEDEPNYAYTVTLTWAQLRPLLRAGTPLNRLLVARGQRPVE